MAVRSSETELAVSAARSSSGSGAPKMRIVVRNLGGEEVAQLDLDPAASVDDLREQLASSTDVPPHWQRLLLTGADDTLPMPLAARCSLSGEGQTCRGEATTLRQASVGDGSELLLIVDPTDVVVTASENGAVKLWSVLTSDCFANWQTHESTLSQAVFSPDGAMIMTAAFDHTAKLWSVQTPGECLGTLRGHSGTVRCACFSQDGAMVCTGSGDSTAKLWSIETGECLRTLKGHAGTVRSIACSPDGTTILTASSDGKAILWDARDGRELRHFSSSSVAVCTAAFARDGERIVTASDDTTAVVWATETAAQLVTLRHDATVLAASFSPDGVCVATASADRTARIWNSTTGARVQVFDGHSHIVRSVDWSPDGVWLVTASGDGTAKLWSVAAGSCMRTLRSQGGAVCSAAFAPSYRLPCNSSERWSERARSTLSSTSSLASHRLVRSWGAASGHQHGDPESDRILAAA